MGEYLDVSIGLGISVPSDQTDISGSGFYAQGEYVYNISNWVGLRPYAGLVLTSTKEATNESNQTDYKMSTKAFLLGGKVRLSIPIPWVAPYVELGVGTSMGSFETSTQFHDIIKNGILLHIPFEFGVSLGKEHTVEVGFTYYFQPAVEQVTGAAAIGLSFPLN
ncbi:hypothetical protein GCM10022393_43250 [Aquimarina addita]|uniref:Outer membrane protein beta-barrel domain-containing protein n=2 Tax=Aquimarina addita TaxID=870485 RepID=A0ABP6UW25_9FLAO